MMLMFQLDRADVLPVDDFGVRNGFRLAYGLRKMPAPKALALVRRALGAVSHRGRVVPVARGGAIEGRHAAGAEGEDEPARLPRLRRAVKRLKKALKKRARRRS